MLERPLAWSLKKNSSARKGTHPSTMIPTFDKLVNLGVHMGSDYKPPSKAHLLSVESLEKYGEKSKLSESKAQVHGGLEFVLNKGIVHWRLLCQ